jgi:hypothetical protein
LQTFGIELWSLNELEELIVEPNSQTSKTLLASSSAQQVSLSIYQIHNVSGESTIKLLHWVSL